MTDAEFAIWCKRGDRQGTILVELDYVYESAGAPAVGTRYLSNRPYLDPTNPTAPQKYVECIKSVPQYSRSLTGDRWGGYQSTVGSLVLTNANAALDSWLPNAIDGSEVRFYYGDVTWPVSDFRLMFSAISDRMEVAPEDTITVHLKDTGTLVNKSIGGVIQIGGSGPNAERFRQVQFGFVHQIECLLIDKNTMTYSYADSYTGVYIDLFGPGTTPVRDRGVQVPFVDHADGTFSLLTPAVGIVTMDVICNAVALAGTIDYFAYFVSDAYAYFIGELCGLTAAGKYAGPGPTYDPRPSVSDDVAAWLPTGEDFKVALQVAEKRNAIDIANDLANTGLCFWAITRLGDFTIGRLRPYAAFTYFGTPAKTMRADDVKDGSFHIEHAQTGYYRLYAQMEKNWKPLTDSDLAGAAITDLYLRDRLKREGLRRRQEAANGTLYADNPQLYDLTLAESPLIETLLAGSGNDVNDINYLEFWLGIRRVNGLPWLETVSSTVGLDFYSVELGDPVTIQMDRYGFNSGIVAQCIGIDIKLSDGVCDVRLLHRRVSVATPGGWTPNPIPSPPQAPPLPPATSPLPSQFNILPCWPGESWKMTLFDQNCAPGAPPAPKKGYGVNTNDNTVTVFDINTRAVIGSPIAVGSGPIYAAMTPSNAKVYVSNFSADTVSVIDTATDTVIATVSVGDGPGHLSVSPDGTKCYVSNNIASTISVIDTATDTVSSTITLTGIVTDKGYSPQQHAYLSDGSKLFVVGLGFVGGTVWSIAQIDTASDTVDGFFDTTGAPSSTDYPLFGCVISSDDSKLYTSDYQGNRILVWNTAGGGTFNATISSGVGTQPQDMVILDDGTKIYIACNASSGSGGGIYVIDTGTDTILTSLALSFPADLKLNVTNTYLLIVANTFETVKFYDVSTDTISGSEPALGTNPFGIALQAL